MGADSACCHDGAHVCFLRLVSSQVSLNLRGESTSLGCLMGDMFAIVQRILKEFEDRLVASVKDLGATSGGSMPTSDHVQELRAEASLSVERACCSFRMGFLFCAVSGPFTA